MLKRIMVLTVLLMLIVMPGCSPSAESTGSQVDSPEKVKVLVSILPQADFVKSIGGDQVEVEVLIPPGANPEDYEMNPRQVQAISEADIYFTVGSIPFEQISLERIQSANPDMPVINTAETLEEAEHVHEHVHGQGEEHHHDPHVWLSPALVIVQARSISTGLSAIDPAHEDLYENNREAFAAELVKLDEDIKLLLAGRKRETFLVYHPAWGNFAADYGLHELAIEKDGKEPTAQEMAQIIKTARQEGIKTIIASPQHSTRSAETIAEQLQGQVIIIDPLPEDYIAGMYDAANIFKELLSE